MTKEKTPKGRHALLPDDIIVPCQICLFENGCEDTWPHCGIMVEGGQGDGAENH